MHDEAAAARLRREVQRLYETHRGEPFTKLGLSKVTGISRPTLDNYLEHGLMPPVEAMERLGSAVGVPSAHLWVKWLDLGMSDPLVRIADALERAYPPDPEEQAEGRRRGEAAARALQAPEGDGSRAKRSAPPSTTGSGR